MDEASAASPLLKALHFAADKHRDQRRKNAEASPYINHPIEVAELLARVGGVTDVITLQGAILHDTIEDTKTTAAELEENFGAAVRAVVEEVTDDKTLEKQDRKRLQIEHAPRLSERAKQIKLADKISNVLGVTHTPPAKWSVVRRSEYLDWTEAVVAGLRGSNPALEKLYDELLAEGRRILGRL
jgi:(p)ppGpp synthase/HD superfamily hydrolase